MNAIAPRKLVRYLTAAVSAAALQSSASGADDLGRRLFESCRACHALDRNAKAMPGPNLAGLLGRQVAGDPNFDYSPVLRAARARGETWTRERLDQFLRDPEAMFPAMWMTSRPMAETAPRQALGDFLAHPNSR
jgi:cytochrome c